MIKHAIITLMIAGLGPLAIADDRKIEAAVGGGAGGAIGAVIGDELGDREGAIVGSAIGAAIGTAIATQDDHSDAHDRPAHAGSPSVTIEVSDAPATHGHPKSRHCPPGQAKKGRC
jgi:hypothetical protein